MTWSMTFSFGGWRTARDIMALLETQDSGFGSAGQLINRINVKNLYAENIQADNMNFLLFDIDDLPDGTSYARILTGHLDAGKIQLIDATIVDAGFTIDKIGEGSSNKYFSGKDLDDLVDGAAYSRVKTTDIDAGHIKLSEVIQTSSYRTVADGEKAVWTAKPDDMDEIGEGTTYKRTLATDISAGHLNLTADFKIDGVSQASAGVFIDAVDGITIKAGKLKFLSSDEVESAVIHLSNEGAGASELHLEAAGFVRVKSMGPDADGTRFFGASNYRWGWGYINTLYTNTKFEHAGIVGFFGTSAVSKPTGVAVTAVAIHAALVTLGLIAGP